MDTIITYKTLLFAGLASIAVVGACLYLLVAIKKMRKQMERVEKIVGFIPFKELVNINEFKLYIRKKY